MRKDFFAYLRLDETELKKVWKNSIFTFDANILLNFYKYRAETTTTFFSLLEKVKDRSWLTNQAVQEYFNNRLIVISEQEKAYSDLKESISNNVEDPLNNQRKHPYIGHDLLEEFKLISSKLRAELDARSKEYSKRLSKDDILEKIVEIFDDKVGDNFDEEKTNDLYKEGDKRYNLDIPPGFKDKKKGGTRQFGDLVLWYQIIELAKKEKKDIVFITDDEKEDWLYIHKGRTIGMLPALQIEFHKLTNQKAHIFNAQRFIEEIGKLSKTTITADTIDEVKTLREENKLIFEQFTEILGDADINENEIDENITRGINFLADKDGWAELAQLGLFLVRNTTLNYRNYGFQSLKRFIESRQIFEIKYEQISPNAKNVDTAYVRLQK
jgi:hypothetical protein